MSNKDYKQIINTFIERYETYKIGNYSFDFIHGELTFEKDDTHNLNLFSIYIYPEFREKGLCRNILCYMIDQMIQHKFNKFCVKSVLSKILYKYLLRFTYKNKQFELYNDGFFYNH